ncbi:MAG: hypothetical protein ACP5VN_00900 [Acidobacteriota bacterium]
MSAAPRIALVGAGTLLAREVYRGLLERGLSKEDLLTFGERPGGWEVAVTEEEGDLFLPLTGEYLEGCGTVFLCTGDPAAREAVGGWASASGALLLDLGTPPGEGDLLFDPFSGPLPPEARRRPLRFPEPESLFLGLLLRGVPEGILGPVQVHLLASASRRGEEAVRELMRQSAALLSFQGSGTPASGRRLAFALHPEEGGTERDGFGREVCRVAGRTLSLSWARVETPLFHGASLSALLSVGDALEAEQALLSGARGPFRVLEGSSWGELEGGEVPETPLLGLRVLSDETLWLWMGLDPLRSGKPWMAIKAFEALTHP